MAKLTQKLAVVFGNPAWVCFIWFGMTAGISFLATPAHFEAQTATRLISLDVSREVFQVLNYAEIIAILILAVVGFLSSQSQRWWAATFIIGAIVWAQTTWLLPELSARTDLIIAGEQPEPSSAHAVFSSLQLVKAILLLIMGFLARSAQFVRKRDD